MYVNVLCKRTRTHILVHLFSSCIYVCAYVYFYAKFVEVRKTKGKNPSNTLKINCIKIFTYKALTLFILF